MKFEWSSEYLETVLSFFRDGCQNGKYIFTVEDHKGDKHDELRELKIMNFLKGTKMKVQLFRTSLQYVNSNFGTLLFSISQNMSFVKNKAIADLESLVSSQREQILALERQVDALKKTKSESESSTRLDNHDNLTVKNICRRRLKVQHKSAIDESQNEEDIEVCFKELKKIRRT